MCCTSFHSHCQWHSKLWLSMKVLLIVNNSSVFNWCRIVVWPTLKALHVVVLFVPPLCFCAGSSEWLCLIPTKLAALSSFVFSKPVWFCPGLHFQNNLCFLMYFAHCTSWQQMPSNMVTTPLSLILMWFWAASPSKVPAERDVDLPAAKKSFGSRQKMIR